MRCRQPHSEETKQKIRAAMLRIGHLPPSQKGKTRSAESRARIRQAKLGQRHSDQTRKLMSESRIGERNHFYGRTHSDSTKARMSAMKVGRRPHNWNPVRTHINEKSRLRHTKEWKDWRKAVFTRDGYICVECGVTDTSLEPHHIIPLRVSFDRMFDLKNGITLCRACHIKTIRKEELYEEKYFSLTNPQ